MASAELSRRVETVVGYPPLLGLGAVLDAAMAADELVRLEHQAPFTAVDGAQAA